METDTVVYPNLSIEMANFPNQTIVTVQLRKLFCISIENEPLFGAVLDCH